MKRSAITRPRESGGYLRSCVLPAGTILGAYVTEELLASGGHGSVYRARHRYHGGLAAIKILHPVLAHLPKMAERFVREAEVIRRLQHPNIVDVYSFGALPDGTPYFVMEYLPGTTLRVWLQSAGRLSPEQALSSVFEPVCAALQAAHAAGVVHRDVKPSNILITEGEPRTLKLVDFGIAKLLGPNAPSRGLTSIGQQLGTPSTMAPEQILGEPVDARTDIYALGILLYHVITGRRPFESAAGDIALQHLEAPPPRPSQRVPLSPMLDAVVLRCLQKRPEHRFQTVTAFLEALRQAVQASDARALTNHKAVGIHVEVLLDEFDDVDDALEVMTAHVLERAEERMKSSGLTLVATTSTQILGVRLLAGDWEQARSERHAALELAWALLAALRQQAAADARVHVNVALHVDTVTVRLAAEPEIASGAIARTDAWTPSTKVNSLCATREAIEGLDSFDRIPGPGVLYLVRPKLGSRPCCRADEPTLPTHKQ